MLFEVSSFDTFSRFGVPVWVNKKYFDLVLIITGFKEFQVGHSNLKGFVVVIGLFSSFFNVIYIHSL
jgi:hypothetical protein